MSRNPILLIPSAIVTLLIILLCGTGVGVAQTVTATIAVNDNPLGVGANPQTDMVYVSNSVSNNVSVINGMTNSKVKDITVGDSPNGVGVNSTTNMVYIANWQSHNVSVINGATGTKIKDIAVANGPQSVSVNQRTNKIYVSNWAAARVTVIDGATNTNIKEITVGTSPMGVQVNPETNTVYVANCNDDTVSVINGATDTKITDVTAGDGPSSVGVNQQTNMVYVTNWFSDNVSVINGATNATVKDIAVGELPGGVSVNQQTGRVYVTNADSDSVSIIDGTTNSKVKDIAVGTSPNGVDVNSEAGLVYVTNRESDNVSVISDPGGSSWYLAEGSTAWGFKCYVTIENPNDTAINCDVTYMTTDGQVAGPAVNMPAKSQATVNPVETLGDKDFSTKVVCREGKPIAVDRSMTWKCESGWSEAHCSIGVTSPATTWYLAEGSTAWGFECWLLIQNPNNSEATCQVTYMIEGDGPQTVEKKVPANSRKTYNMADDIGARDASIKIESNVAVIPERAMYRNSRREGHDSIGTTRPTLNYYLAEGATGYASSFTTYVLIQNPNDTATDVTVTYMTGGGPVIQPAFQMPANSRKTLKVNDVFPTDTDFSTAVTGTQPIIAERAMYWYGDPNHGEVCHDSIGMSASHVNFYLPAGGTTNYWETWTLVQNPNGSDVTVEISYLMPNGQNNVVWQEVIGAQSRRSFNMVEKVPNSSAAVMVRSLDPSKKIMVERAMYWYGRNAGTSTIGGYSD